MSARATIVRHVLVRGRVQGVGYRAWVDTEARRRDLEGWVRNRRDGTVEMVFAGPSATVDDMIAACRRGPPLARVDALDVLEARDSDLDDRKAGRRFCVISTH